MTNVLNILLYIIVSTPVHSSCNLELAIQAGNLSFDSSLQGVQLNIAMLNEGLPWSVYDSTTNKFTGGFCVEIVNELANMAGFTANISLFDLEGDETYTQALERVLKWNDFAGTWYTDASDRRILNMNFAHHFLDSSVVLIIPKPQYQQKTFSMTAFLKPFTPNLWGLLVFGIIFNAICSFCLHLMAHPKKCEKCTCQDTQKLKELVREFGSYVYTSFGHFTAAGEGFEPVSIWSRINTILWSFLVVIVLASYTANLAKALISEADVESSLDSIDAIVMAGKPICINIASNRAPKIKVRWPDIKFVDARLQTFGPLMRNDTCVGALMGYVEAQVVLAESCDMQLTTTRILPSGGSFVFQTDENRCGPTKLKLLDYYLVRLAENGILDELWAKEMELFECQFDAPDAQPKDANDIRLSVYDLGGLSLIYGIGAVILIVANSVVFYFRKRYAKNQKMTEAETELAIVVNDNKTE